MKILNREYQLSNNKTSCFFIQLALHDQDLREIAFGAVIDGHVKIHGSLEGKVHLDDEGGAHFFKDVGLTHCILELLLCYEFLLVEYFQSISSIVFEVLGFINLAE